MLVPSLQRTFTHISRAPEQPFAKIISLAVRGAVGTLCASATALRACKVPECFSYELLYICKFLNGGIITVSRRITVSLVTV